MSPTDSEDAKDPTSTPPPTVSVEQLLLQPLNAAGDNVRTSTTDSNKQNTMAQA